MRSLSKNRKGFTLVELVVVLCIIVILASVTALSVSTYIQRAQDAQDSVSDEVNAAKNNISMSESKLASYGF